MGESTFQTLLGQSLRRSTGRRGRGRKTSLALCLALVIGLTSLLTQSAQASGPGSGGNFVPLQASRLVDTAATGDPLVSGETRTYSVLGVAGVPSTGVAAVLLQATATSTTSADGSLTVWTSGTSRPQAPDVSFASTTTPRDSSVAVALGADGSVSMYNADGQTNIAVDVIGYFAPVTGSQAPGSFSPVEPFIDLDSQDGINMAPGQLSAGASVTVDATDLGQVPVGAAAVFATLEVDNATSSGQIKIAPDGEDANSTDSVAVYGNNGPTDIGLAIPLAADGKFSLLNVAGGAGIDLKISIEGYFSGAPDGSGWYKPVSQTTLVDTVASGSPLAPGETRSISVGGVASLPEYGVAGALMSVTVESSSADGNLEVYRSGFGDPQIPTVSFAESAADAPVSTSSVVEPGSYGTVTLQNNSSGDVDVVITLQGWFAAQQLISGATLTAYESGASASGYSQDWIDQSIYDDAMLEGTTVTESSSETSVAVDPSQVDVSLDPNANAQDVSASGCKQISATIVEQNWFGHDLWHFQQTSLWCYNGREITYRYSEFHAPVYYVEWEFDGLTDSESTPGPPWIRFREGEFKHCIWTPWGEVCPTQKFAWIRQTMRKDGTYVQDHGVD